MPVTSVAPVTSAMPEPTGSVPPPTTVRSPWRTAAAVLVGTTAAGLLVAPSAEAHPGHLGGAADGLVHPLLGVDHLLAMVAVGVLAALVVDRRAAWATPVAFVVGTALGGVVGMAVGAIPALDAVVAATVVVLGLLVATGLGGRRAVAGTRAARTWALPLAAAAMGILHGAAHGAELPMGATPVAYAAGFLVTTAALHTVGAATGIVLRRLPAVRVALGSALCAAGVGLAVGLG